MALTRKARDTSMQETTINMNERNITENADTIFQKLSLLWKTYPGL